MNKMPKLLLVCAFLLSGCATMAPAKTGPAKVETKKYSHGHWQLLVNGRPYFIRGVVYTFSVVGDDPNTGTQRDWMTLDLNHNGKNDVAYDSWVDKNGNNIRDPDEKPVGDWQLLKDMGCNTIRIYQMPSNDPRLEGTNNYHGARLNFEHPPNKKIFRDLARRYGIMVMIGHFFGEWTLGSGAKWEDGTDYTDPVQRERLLTCVRVMVEEHKDEPYTLMWVLGNENFNPYDQDNAETQPEAFLTLVNEAAQMIHEMDPNHPVAICNWHMDHLEDIARWCPDVDIYGTNNYRHGLTLEFARLAAVYDRPMVITEYGIPDPERSMVDVLSARAYHKLTWRDIYQNRYGGSEMKNSIGGCVFEWSDQWFLGGSPGVHDDGDFLGVENAEWYGLTGQGDGSDSPFLRVLKPEYELYREIWHDNVPINKAQ